MSRPFPEHDYTLIAHITLKRRPADTEANLRLIVAGKRSPSLIERLRQEPFLTDPITNVMTLLVGAFLNSVTSCEEHAAVFPAFRDDLLADLNRMFGHLGFTFEDFLIDDGEDTPLLATDTEPLPDSRKLH